MNLEIAYEHKTLPAILKEIELQNHIIKVMEFNLNITKNDEHKFEIIHYLRKARLFKTILERMMEYEWTFERVGKIVGKSEKWFKSVLEKPSRLTQENENKLRRLI